MKVDVTGSLNCTVVGQGNQSTDMVVVQGSGDREKDREALTAAAAAAATDKIGTIGIRDPVIVDQHYELVGAKLRGLNRCAELINYRGQGGFRWNGTWSPHGGTEACVEQDFAERLLVLNGAHPARGNWVLLWSDDVLEGMEPHYLDGTQHPMELHHVQDQSQPGVFVVDSWIRDRMTQNCQMQIVPMTRGVVVADLLCSCTEEQPNYTTFFQVRCTEGARFENVHFLREGAGAISAQFAANTVLDGCTIAGTLAGDGVYGLVAGVVNGFRVVHSTLAGTRHVFTTTCGAANAGARKRWGTPLGVLFDDCLLRGGTKHLEGSSRSRILWDTHPEGYGVTIQNSRVELSGDPMGPPASNVGLQLRSRGGVIRNCEVVGNRGAAKGIRSYATDTLVQGGRVSGCWVPIWFSTTNVVACHRGVVQGTIIENCHGPGIVSAAGDGHLLDGVVFMDTGITGTGSPQLAPACVQLEGGHGHRVYGCTMPRYHNTQSVETISLGADDIDLRGNLMTGYGPNLAGLSSPAIAERYTQYNVHD